MWDEAGVRVDCGAGDPGVQRGLRGPRLPEGRGAGGVAEGPRRRTHLRGRQQRPHPTDRELPPQPPQEDQKRYNILSYTCD